MVIRYIPIRQEIKPWENAYDSVPTLDRSVHYIVDPYVRGPSMKDAERAFHFEKWDNLHERERQRYHDDVDYGKDLYDDEMQLREKGYTGKVSPLVRRKGFSNRYR